MKRIIFLIFSIILFIFAFIQAKPVEVELMKAFISPHSAAEGYLVKLANLSSKKVNIIFEASSLDELEDMKAEFPDMKTDYSAVTDVYSKYPGNFLSNNMRELLKNKSYKKVQEDAVKSLYNPLGIYISPPDKDPYLLATDFLLSNSKFLENDTKEFGGKYYSVLHAQVNSNDELEQIIEAAKGKTIYLTGTPVHSYYASKKSNIEINIICIISTLALAALCRFYFRSFKVVIPVAFSILFGFLFGYSAAALIFKKLHVLTFVFSTSLIGISLDYSLHYFLTGNDKEFKKSLTASMLTTACAFWGLLFSNIEVLRQIGIFTSFGLIGVWLFVILVLSDGEFKHNSFKKIKLPQKALLVVVFVVIAAGIFRVKFDDNIKNLYIPPKNLLAAENLYQKVFNPVTPEFLIIHGNNINEILQKTESINERENIYSVSLSNFVSSEKRQQENITLVQDLYKNDLKKYESRLGTKFEPQKPVLYNPENFPLVSEFELDKNSSFMMVNEPVKGSLNIADEISKILKRLRLECFTILPCVFAMLFLLLSIMYGIKNAFKITMPPLLGIIFTVALLSLCGVNLNLFHILGLFLILGFSLDYSIFRLNGGEKSKDAVLMSAASTAFSFLLLSFTSFKLISSLGLTLFIGITASYILSLFMIKSNHGTR